MEPYPPSRSDDLGEVLLTLRHLRHPVPALNRLRRLLKVMMRSFAWECTRIEPAPDAAAVDLPPRANEEPDRG